MNSKTVSAIDEAEQSVATMRALTRKEPHDWHSFTKLVAALDKLAGAYTSAGQLQKAVSAYKDSVQTRKQAAAMDKGDIDLQCLVCAGLDALKDACVRVNDLDAAEAATRESLDSLRSLRIKFPSALLIQRSMISPLDLLARFERVRHNNLDGERTAYLESRDIARACCNHPQATDADKRRLAVMLLKIAAYHEQSEEFGKAKIALLEALSIAQQGVIDNRDNDLRSDIPITALPLIRLLNTMSEYESALDHNKQVLPCARKVLASTPNSVSRKKLLADLLSEAGKSFYRKRDADSARENYREAIGISRNLLENQPDNAEFLDALATNLAGLFDALALDDMHAEALVPCKECVSISQILLQKDPSSVRYKDLLASRLFALMVFEEKAGSLESTHAAAEQRLLIETELVAEAPSPRSLLRLADALWFAAQFRKSADREAPLRQVFTLLTRLETTGLLTDMHRAWLCNLQQAFRGLEPDEVLHGGKVFRSEFVDAVVACIRWSDSTGGCDGREGVCANCNVAIRIGSSNIPTNARFVCLSCLKFEK